MNKKLKTASIIAALVFLVCIAVYAFISEESSLFTPITDSLFVILGAIAGIMALFTFKTIGWKAKEGKVWLLLGLGFIGLSLGELLWIYNEVILGIEPFPSTADIFYISSYIPMIIALWIEYTVIKEAIQKKEVVKASILTIIATIVSAYFVLIPIIKDAEYDLVSKVTSLSYPIGDLLVLLPVLIFFFVFKGAKMSKSWLLVAIAMTFGVIADSLFAYFDWNELYAGIPLIITDLFWLADYVVFALAAYYHRLIVKGET